MTNLILLRHGQSTWNKKNLFTGWVDIPLSPEGIEEAQRAGELLKNISIDIAFSSTLIRAIMTAMIALTTRSATKSPMVIHDSVHAHENHFSKVYSEKALDDSIPVYLSDSLNERMYGKLQGLNKKETIEIYGEAQVHEWRRSFDTPPPEGESLKMTMERTLPHFKSEILPQLKNGKNILIVAHGNSLRSIIKEIEQVSDESIASYELQTGQPMVYFFNGTDFSKER